MANSNRGSNGKGGKGGNKGNRSNIVPVVNEMRFMVHHSFVKRNEEGKIISDEIMSESIVKIVSTSYMDGNSPKGGFVQMELEGDSPNINIQCLSTIFGPNSDSSLSSIFDESIEDMNRALEQGRRFAIKFEEKDHGRGNFILYEIVQDKIGNEQLDRLGHLYVTASGSISNFSFRRICLASLILEASSVKPCPLDPSNTWVQKIENGEGAKIDLASEGLKPIASIGDLIQRK